MVVETLNIHTSHTHTHTITSSDVAVGFGRDAIGLWMLDTSYRILLAKRPCMIVELADVFTSNV